MSSTIKTTRPSQQRTNVRTAGNLALAAALDEPTSGTPAAVRALSTERPASRGDVLHELAKIMDNLERMAYAHKWAAHYEAPATADPKRAFANRAGAGTCHREIVASVLAIGKIAVPNDPYLTTELTMRMSAIRAARL